MTSFKLHPNAFLLVALAISFGTLTGCDRSQQRADLERKQSAEKMKSDAEKEGKIPEKLEKHSTPTQDEIDAQTALDSDQDSSDDSHANLPPIVEKIDLEIEDNWKQINEKFEIWVDKKAGQVMFSGEVCLKDGQLEMFICPYRTKTHESVISATCDAKMIHAALLVVECKPGKTCSWDPTYRPAWGPTIDIDVMWHDAETKKTKTQNGKEWIRDVKTKKAMTQKWIFGGSEFWTDPDTKENVYYGDAGELVCLSNFSTATIDVGVQSSDANDGLMFETFTENIPPVGTKVYVILKPGEIVKPENVEPKEEKVDAKTDEAEKLKK